MKRKSILFSMVLAIVALLANTEIPLAGSIPPNPTCNQDPNGPTIPTCCDLVDSSGNVSGLGLAVPPGEWPVQVVVGGVTKYKWVYQFIGSPTVPITTLAPVCDPGLVTTLDSSQILPGVIFTLNSSPPYVYFYTDKEAIGRASLQSLRTQSVNKILYCRNIEGPVCVPPGISTDLLPCNTYAFLNVKNPYKTDARPWDYLDLKFEKDCMTKCAKKVYQCNQYTPPDYNDLLHCTGWLEIFPEEAESTVDGEKLKSCFSPTAEGTCQECMFFTAGSPGCYTYSTGGKTFKIGCN